MRSWRPFFFAVLVVVACSDDTQKPLLTSQSGTGQPGWQWSNPHPQGNDLNDVDFFDQRIGFAAGTFGAIVRTVDGGINWELQKSGTTEWLFGVAASGARSAVAVGANGTILRTINRGATWERRQSGVTAGLSDVDFADANHGIAVGRDVILRTADGGLSWLPADLSLLTHDPEGHISFNRVSMVDANTAFAVGWFLVFATFDGGATWVERPTGRQGFDLRGVCFTDANVGTVVGTNASVFRTLDGGVTWAQQNAGTRSNLRGVAFVDPNHGVILGGDHDPFMDYFLSTSDGGETWTGGPTGRPAPGVLIDFRSVAMLDADTGVVVGSQGNIFRITDAGRSWEHLTLFPAIRFPGIAFANANDGIAVGPATILRTRNGGASWERHIPGPLFLFDVSYFGASGVVTVGLDQGSGGVALRSIDAGTTWVPTLTGANVLLAVDCADGSIGAAAGNGGSIFRTTDAGATWLQQQSGTQENLNDVSVLNASVAVAVGENGTLLRTTDGGTLWQTLPQSGVTARLTGVDFADSEVGFVVGSDNTILRTTDGGATWVSQDSGMNGNFLDVACPERNSAVALATVRNDAARVIVTTDGGDHWAPSDPILTSLGPLALCIAGKKTVAVAGDFGMIMQNHHIFP
jgi:photosystem II stability/assembly factor-like uncharacterized protein